MQSAIWKKPHLAAGDPRPFLSVLSPLAVVGLRMFRALLREPCGTCCNRRFFSAFDTCNPARRPLRALAASLGFS